jgi:hypothetical protein
VAITDFVTPIASSDWDNVQLGVNNGALNGSLDFFVHFPSQTDMSVVISNNNVSFETGSLSCLGLLLDWLDLHDFFLQFCLFTLGLFSAQ